MEQLRRKTVCTLNARIWHSTRLSLFTSGTCVLAFTRIRTHEALLSRALSVDLSFTDVPEDLMTKFVDCLVQLPNLRTLEVYSTSHIHRVRRGLERECARFPNIRELWAGVVLEELLGCCPNVESVAVLGGLFSGTPSSRGIELKNLKRVAGITDRI